MNAMVEAAKAKLPAHLQAFAGLGATNDDLTGGIQGGYPVISYKGKVWALVSGGQREILLNADGDPRASINLVILKANPNLSKSFYKDTFEEGSSEAPTCHSFNGIVPEVDVVERQSPACATCPRNVWGSKISDNGTKGRECSDVRRMAVADPEDLDNPALLRVPAGSFKELTAWSDKLKKSGAVYQQLVTKVRFDPEVAHPKFMFSPERWLTAEEVQPVLELIESDKVKRIVYGEVGAAPAPQLGTGSTALENELGAAPAHVQAAAPEPQTPAAAPVQAKAPAKKAAAAKVKPEEVADILQAEPEEQPTKAAAPMPTAQSEDAAIIQADSAIGSILSGLFDD